MADWQNTLDHFLTATDKSDNEPKQSAFEKFIDEVAVPAFEELRPALEKHGRRVVIRHSSSSAVIAVLEGTTEEIMYRLQERTLPDRKLPYAQVRMRERGGLRLVTVEAMLRSGGNDYHTEDLTREEVIGSVLQHYMSRVKLTR